MAKTLNRFEQGITEGEAFDQVPAEGGAPVDQGVPKITEEFLAAQGEWRGVPMPGPGMIPDAEDMPPAKCVATTRKGNPCKAYAVADSVHCVGHNK